ncbi:ECF transporter S component [Brevibacillus dissolubilis]|uniref:ECF transporter S component n=1 Tax=Brevibacillus dissolubilis TaxID=1844116 RepID=UPI001116B08A|nr:ECF transporter S component [Brevibacillus dissolubilis]
MSLSLGLLIGIASLFALVLIWFEKSKTDEKKLAVIATLGAVAAVARIPFGFLPNVQPTTFLVMLSGYVFGVRVGFLVGAIAAVLSNMYFGQGPWTLWQMLSWGLAGAFGGGLGKVMERKGEDTVLRPLLATTAKKWTFVLFCALWGYLFGWIMNLWYIVSQGKYANWGTFFGAYVSSFSFDTAHAVGNFVFASLFAVSFARIFARYHRKLVTTRESVVQAAALSSVEKPREIAGVKEERAL